jgi:hypothetical protein
MWESFSSRADSLLSEPRAIALTIVPMSPRHPFIVEIFRWHSYQVLRRAETVSVANKDHRALPVAGIRLDDP